MPMHDGVSAHYDSNGTGVVNVDSYVKKNQ